MSLAAKVKAAFLVISLLPGIAWGFSSALIEKRGPEIQPSTCSSTGPQRIAVIVANYPNSGYANVSIDYLRELFLGTQLSPFPSIKDYYSTVSEQKVSLDRVDFFGPYSFSQPYVVDTTQVSMTSGTGTYDYDRAIFALAQGDVQLQNYDRLVLFSPEALDASTGQRLPMAAGLSSVGCTQTFNDGRISKMMGVSWLASLPQFTGDSPSRIATYWQSLSSAELAKGLVGLKVDDMRSIVHEILHTFGLGHANSIETTSDILPDSDTPMSCHFYGDYFDVMADSVTAPLNIPHREELGWLSENEVQTITQAGTFRIYPADFTDSAHSKLIGLKIPRVKSPGDFTDAVLWVEYRNGTSPYEANSSTGSEAPYDGALVHYTNPRQVYTSDKFHWGNETLVLNFKPGVPDTGLSVGTNQVLRGTWQDAHSQVGLELVKITPSYIDVKVSFVAK
jgi:hypothetical protein